MATTQTAGPATSNRFTGREMLILILLCGTQFMLALDFSILSVALPQIGSDLDIGVRDLSWIITAFALPCGGLLLLMGRCADLFGRRRLYLIGMVLFTVSSTVGGLAQTQELLFAARAGQGLAAAILTPAAMSLLTTSFQEGTKRDRALGINGTLLSLGFLTGVVAGGFITDLLSWRWSLLVNLPLGILAIVGAVTLLRESRVELGAKLDVIGGAAVTIGLLAIIFGTTSIERAGWSSPATWGALAVGVVLLGLFLVIERTMSNPLIDLGVLGRRSVAWSNFTGLVTFSMVTAVVFLLTLYMQRVRGFTPLETGFALGALGVCAVLGGMASAKVIGRIGARSTLILGLGLQAVSTFAMVLLAVDQGMLLFIVAAGVVGLGHVFAVVAYMVIGTTGIPAHEQGMATGLLYTSQQLGLTLGTPLIAAVAASQFGSGTVSASTTLSGLHLGFLVAGVMVVLGIIAAVAMIRPPSAPATLAAEAPAEPADLGANLDHDREAALASEPHLQTKGAGR